MTIFISCSLADKDIFDELAEYLRQRGHIIYPRSGKYLSSLLITSLRKDIAESDFFVALISENFSNSKIALTELNIASFTGNATILPFILGSASVPVSVADIDCEKADSKEELVEKVLNCVTLLENTEKHEDSPGGMDQKNGNQKDGNQEEGDQEEGIQEEGIQEEENQEEGIQEEGIQEERIQEEGIQDCNNSAAGYSNENENISNEGISDDSSSHGKVNKGTLTGRNDTVQPEIYNTENKIAALRKAFAGNQLTLVCGAGISSDSAIPTWHDLLVNILNDIYSDHDPSNPDDMVSAEYLLSLMPESNLILGKYLRILLADSFEKVVQKHLYANYNQKRGLNSCTEDNSIESISTGDSYTESSSTGDSSIESSSTGDSYTESSSTEVSYTEDGSAEQNLTCHDDETPILKAIVELAHPKNSDGRLESIITFNFDDLIEKALTNHGIDCASIWKEGQTCRPDQLPVFHVHGFLPNQEELDSPNLVFSEESYHSQFNDPYSWANLTQLNSFSTDVCLFIGISLSDPDLRRLLDIIWGKNHACKHYIIMKKSDRKSKTDEIANMLFEQDAYLLGLNVIWCSEFSEIPDILSRIAGTIL